MGAISLLFFYGSAADRLTQLFMAVLKACHVTHRLEYINSKPQILFVKSQADQTVSSHFLALRAHLPSFLAYSGTSYWPTIVYSSSVRCLRMCCTREWGKKKKGRRHLRLALNELDAAWCFVGQRLRAALYLFFGCVHEQFAWTKCTCAGLSD